MLIKLQSPIPCKSHLLNVSIAHNSWSSNNNQLLYLNLHWRTINSFTLNFSKLQETYFFHFRKTVLVFISINFCMYLNICFMKIVICSHTLIKRNGCLHTFLLTIISINSCMHLNICFIKIVMWSHTLIKRNGCLHTLSFIIVNYC